MIFKNLLKLSVIVMFMIFMISCADKSSMSIKRTSEYKVSKSKNIAPRMESLASSEMLAAINDENDISDDNEDEEKSRDYQAKIADELKKYDEESIIDDAILPDLKLEISEHYTADSKKGNKRYYEEFKEFNVPMTVTDRVSAYIDFFTEKVPGTTQRWINRANKYMYLVRDIFVKEGLPTDLMVLAFTESGYNTQAVSHAGAAGMWQFIPSTGKMYGMNVNFWVDERRDFEKATYAAARYLKYLYAKFGDWYLALAAYNAGPGKISKATKLHDTKDFFSISKNKTTLKAETRDYVPKFLALLIIYKNYVKYNFTVPAHEPLLYDKIKVKSQVNLYWLSKQIGADVAALRELNPSLKLPITPPGEYEIRVPYRMGAKAAKIIGAAKPNEMAMFKIYNAKQGELLSRIAAKTGSSEEILRDINGLTVDIIYSARPIFIPATAENNPEMNKEFAAVLSKLSPKFYKVRKGDTFRSIAHKHNMKVADLQKLNPNVKTKRFYAGQRLAVSGKAVPVKNKSAALNNKTQNIPVKKNASVKKKAELKNGKYKVKKGDTIWSIARKTKTTVETIKKLNKLKNNDIHAGKELIIKK